MNGTEWAAFDAAAKAEAIAMAVNAPPLERGQYVAWTIQGDFGYTQSLSAKHMAFGDLVTLCGEHIPPRIRRLPVAYKTLKLCGECAVKYAIVMGGLGA